MSEIPVCKLKIRFSWIKAAVHCNIVILRWVQVQSTFSRQPSSSDIKEVDHRLKQWHADIGLVQVIENWQSQGIWNEHFRALKSSGTVTAKQKSLNGHRILKQKLSRNFYLEKWIVIRSVRSQIYHVKLMLDLTYCTFNQPKGTWVYGVTEFGSTKDLGRSWNFVTTGLYDTCGETLRLDNRWRKPQTHYPLSCCAGLWWCVETASTSSTQLWPWGTRALAPLRSLSGATTPPSTPSERAPAQSRFSRTSRSRSPSSQTSVQKVVMFMIKIIYLIYIWCQWCPQSTVHRVIWYI